MFKVKVRKLSQAIRTLRDLAIQAGKETLKKIGQFFREGSQLIREYYSELLHRW